MSVLPIGPSFDFASSQSVVALSQRTQYGKTYKYDFAADDFVLDVITGKVVVLDGTAALAQCIEKIWRTERFQALIYTGSYGSDVLSVARAGNLDDDKLLIDLDRVVIEGAQLDPRVLYAADLDLTLDNPNFPTSLRIQCNVRDIFGITTAMDVTLAIT